MSTEVLEALTDCNCWVRNRPLEEQFGLRWGAHSKDCPMHSESRDPVDKIQDGENRAYGEANFS